MVRPVRQGGVGRRRAVSARKGARPVTSGGGGGGCSRPVYAQALEPWFFMDDAGGVQGPYGCAVLANWCDRGFFDENTRVRRGDSGGPFVRLGDMYRDMERAFRE